MEKDEAADRRKALCQELAKIASVNGLTIENLVERTGFKTNTVASILRGQFSPSLDLLIILAEAIGVDIEFKDI